MATSKRAHNMQRRRGLGRAFASRVWPIARVPLGATLIASAVLVPQRAHAGTTDVSPPLPNVLILLDSSGSMERLPNGKLPTKDDGSAMSQGSVATVAKTRWVDAVEVLGGQIKGYQLFAEDRSLDDFRSEFGLVGQDPYDTSYSLLHYRPISCAVAGTCCTVGSNTLTKTGTWPDNWSSWDVSTFGFRQLLGGGTLGPINAVGGCTSSNFQTDNLGILDTFRDQARFALMTFDNAPPNDSGYAGGTHLGHEVQGMNGLWSYYPGWDGTAWPSGTGPQYGWPATCSVVDSTTLNTHQYENGARNPSAPPWEGPLIPFSATDDSASLRAVNDKIKWAISSMRPYGATPIGPMLKDAENYYWNDPSGPPADPQDACRGNFVVLITDGFPNQDLRDASTTCQNNADPTKAAVWAPSSGSPCVFGPGTGGGGGCCPSRRPQDVAYELSHPPAGKPAVSTFVIGFALSDDSGNPIDCSSPAVDPVTGTCNTMPTSDPRYPCCALNEIAYNGGTGKALIATSSDTLKGALVAAMASATATTTTSRTLPIFAGLTDTSTGSQNQYEFRSSFRANPFTSWSGILERVRYQCTASGTGGLTPQPQTFSPLAGDDLTVGINATTNRHFLSWNGLDTSSGNGSGDSIRPNLAGSSDSDGVQKIGGNGSIDSFGSGFVSNTLMTPQTMNITATTCADLVGKSNAADLCKQRYLNYALALPQPDSTWASRVGNAFADPYHGTPVSVSTPNAFLRDESYATWRTQQANRQPMLLVPTNDGMLHAFKTNATDTTNAELWAFLPPGVLPSLSAQYAGAHALLLDMSPVVKDVAFGPVGSATTAWGRTRAQAQGGTATWRTVAVGALTAGRGYYALDVTDPAAPKFLWQLSTIKDTKNSAVYNLFGDFPSPPAIGTVYYAEPGNQPVETPVAFLPGGSGTNWKAWNSGSSPPQQCTRWSSWGVGERNKTRCWSGPGASLTVVRLYDGKILRTFRNDPAGLSPYLNHPAEAASPVLAFKDNGALTVVTGSGSAATGYANIDAPITGAVALYPGAVGTVTTRAFVGDEDGDLWRIDVSATDPGAWSMALFHDAYEGNSFLPGSGGSVPDPPQPVAVAPVITVDRLGNVVTVYATGDQAPNFSLTAQNHMYSVSEKITGTTPTFTVTPVENWHLPFINGVTPTGPLSLFSGNLYFSTFTPGTGSSSACIKGSGTLWGIDFIETEGSTGLPRARFQLTPTEPASDASGVCPASTGITNADARSGMGNFFRCIQLPSGTIVFGAGITQRPSCVDTSTIVGNDPYIGGPASHATINDINQGDFQLVAQTGPKSTGATGPVTATNTFTRTLVAPVSVTKIDSWAAIVE